MKMFIVFAFMALIVSSYGKPLAQEEREAIENDAREILTKNVQVHQKWTIFQQEHPTGASGTDIKSATVQLEIMCREYNPVIDAPSTARDLSHLCDLIKKLTKP